MVKGAIQKLVEGRNLSEREITEVLNCIMEGNATQAQIGSFITALRIKGETIEEITGCAKVMREKAEKIVLNKDYFIDIVGTGGDCSYSFNISTAASFVAAAGGVTVAKHGNRSVSSKSGSADVLESLGVNISLEPEKVKECIEKLDIGFMFAQTFHKSMKHAAGPRKELGIRTIFNILGPLTNPACAKGQVLGVFSEKLTEPLANVLLNLDVENAMVVYGLDGMDEISLSAPTRVSELRNGRVDTYDLNPEDYGFKLVNKSEIVGGDSRENADIILSILKGERGAKRDIVVLNAAAALYVGKAADNIQSGIKLAEEIIDSGKALNKLNELVDFSNSLCLAVNGGKI